MKKCNKKHAIIILSTALIVALIVFFVVIPMRKKIKAPTVMKQTTESATGEGTIDITVPSGDTRTIAPSTTSGSTTPSSSTSGAVAPTETPANPDSSTSITTPQTTDYSNVTGSNFDARN